jgi:hypothetical protein
MGGSDSVLRALQRLTLVMAGLVPAIYALLADISQDARNKSEHDGEK